MKNQEVPGNDEMQGVRCFLEWAEARRELVFTKYLEQRNNAAVRIFQRFPDLNSWFCMITYRQASAITV
jgi:hypothetical protein